MGEMTFEKAMKRLEQITHSLEEGELPLEKGLEAFEEGMGLIRFCAGKLEEAEKKVTLLMQNQAGLTNVPFSAKEGEDDPD